MFIELLGGSQILTTGKSLSETYLGIEDTYVILIFVENGTFNLRYQKHNDRY